jgi:hypothetical protein
LETLHKTLVVATVAQFLSQALLFRWASSELVCLDLLSAHAAACPTSHYRSGGLHHLTLLVKGLRGVVLHLICNENS